MLHTYGNTNWRDQLTGLSLTENGTTYTGTYSYDGSGNPTGYFNPGDHSQWTMTWRNGRQLATATNGTYNLSYGYDVNGLRTYKIVDGVRHDYVYASGKLLQETWTQSGIKYRLEFLYDRNGNPFLLNYTVGNTTTTYYYLCNLQGDVVELVTAAGVPAATYRYNAWGHIEASTGSMAAVNPLRYRGYYFDTETGFYYLQSRYYDPALGRFLNADGYASTGQGFLGYNMFAYCGNNPVCCVDPSGNRSIFFEGGNVGYTDSGTGCKYIQDQAHCVYSNWKLGNSTLGENGCAIFAVNTYLIDQNVQVSFLDVYIFMTQPKYLADVVTSNGKIITVIEGAKAIPDAIEYFTGEKVEPKVIRDSSDYKDYNKPVILSIMAYDDNHNINRTHFVAGIPQNGGYTFYNTTLNCGGHTATLSAFIEIVNRQKTYDKLNLVVGIIYAGAN